MTEALKSQIKVCMFDQYGTVVDMQTGLAAQKHRGCSVTTNLRQGHTGAGITPRGCRCPRYWWDSPG